MTQTTQGSLRRNVVSEMEHGQRMRDDLIDIDRNTMHRRAELRELTDTAETLKAALGELTRKHQDLKRYVAHKYFPEGHMDSAGLDRNVAKLHLFDQGLSDIPSLAFDGNRAWVKAGYIYKRTSQGRSCSPSRSHSPAVSNRSVSPSLLRTPVATPRMPSVRYERRVKGERHTAECYHTQFCSSTECQNIVLWLTLGEQYPADSTFCSPVLNDSTNSDANSYDQAREA